MQSEPDRRAAGAGGRRGPRGAVSTRLFPGTHSQHAREACV